MKLNIKKISIILITTLAFLVGSCFVYAAILTKTLDDYTTDELVAEYAILTGGKLKLGGPTYTGITEDTCNAVPGWHWYVTSDSREACWSKSLIKSVVYSSEGTPGEYTCAQDVESLTERMEAASNQEWSKIISSGGVSALAIADCLDRVRDLCTGTGCSMDITTWSNITGGSNSALPSYNDYVDVCGQHSGNDLPLRRLDGLFYRNFVSLTDGGARQCSWYAGGAVVGGDSCSFKPPMSWGGYPRGLRILIRP